MSWRSVPFARRAALIAAALVLTAAPLNAGGTVRVKAGSQSPPPPSPPPLSAYLPYRPPSVALSVVVSAPAQPAREPVYVNLRGPDGQVRRFLVEGGREAIEYREVVLHPGESVTVQLAARR